jgi:hypothetical protein
LKNAERNQTNVHFKQFFKGYYWLGCVFVLIEQCELNQCNLKQIFG